MYEFGPFCLDTSQRVLHRDGQLVSIPPKALDTLFALVEGEGKVIGKEELLRRVWPETFVEEGNLTQNISVLRKALGEGTNGQQYIQTIPKRGYRFVAAVAVSSEANRTAPESLAAQPSSRPPRKYALTGTTLVLAAGLAFLAMRYPRAKPLTDQDVLVLADFTNSTGDPVFDNVLRGALAYQLEQSPFLKVLDDSVIREDLTTMRRSPQELVTNDLAHDICLRENEKAMLGGSIAGLGKSYVIELKATNCRTGRTLAREYAEAADKDHVLQALAKAAQGIRAKLGESLSSIEALAPPPDAYRVTTQSLEALQDFRTGADLYTQGRLSEALPALQRATELDPDLAFAWAWRAVATLNSTGSRERSREFSDRAWALRDRVSAYERLWIMSSRGGQTSGQYIEEYESWARTYPRDPMPVIALGRIHVALGEFEKALAKFQEANRIDPPRRAIHVIDLMMMYCRLDRFEEAKAVAAKMFAQGQDAPMLHLALLSVAYARDDEDEAAKQIAWFAREPEGYLSLLGQAAEARTRGQLRRSRELLERAADLARIRIRSDAAAEYLRPDSGGDALIGKCRAAQGYPNGPPDISRPIGKGDLSDAALALCRSPALAERAEKLNREWTSCVQCNPARVPLRRAAAELGLGRPDQAIELLKSVAPYERAYPMANFFRGLAYLRLKRGAEAAAEFQKILDHRGANWGPLYPLSYIGTARGAALAGDTAGARKAYETFFALWKDADSEVPILIQARKEYGNLGR